MPPLARPYRSIPYTFHSLHISIFLPLLLTLPPVTIQSDSTHSLSDQEGVLHTLSHVLVIVDPQSPNAGPSTAMADDNFHSFSTVHERTRSGWDYCMTKAYCKYARLGSPNLTFRGLICIARWPAIAGIILAILVFGLTAFCCLRCCFCRRRGGRNRSNSTSMFSPAPYQGYQPANNPQNAPPPYGAPPRFAQFDAPSGTKKVTEDSLPAMPSWDAAPNKRVEHEVEDVEMGHLEKPPIGHKPMHSIGANSSSLNLLKGQEDQNDALAHDGHLSPHYTGPDFGYGAGHPYTGPKFDSEQRTAYSAYAPSESTRYEPSEPQELGTTYNNTVPPPGPGAHQQGLGPRQHDAPSVLQAGRRPEGNGSNSWKDI